MSKTADEKILALVNPEYIKRIPFFVRGHATSKSCEYIAQKHPELYAGDGIHAQATYYPYWLDRMIEEAEL